MGTEKSMAEKKVLLIEDEPNYRALILAVLRRAGMQCTSCTDGDHAIKKMAQESFDLTIIDYLLPGPNAVDIVRWMRTQKIDTPALIITNYPSEDLTNKTKVLTKTRLVPKPSFDPMNIPSIVQDMITSK
jgi:DNA-binding response OmpR family regulator